MATHGERAALRAGAVLMASALFTVAPQALAEGSAVVAEALFREGRALMDKGDFAAACPKLAESHAQDPATGTLVALARCEERGGKLASAWVHYNEALQRAKREGRADREAAVREQLQLVEPKLSYLTIEVDGSNAALAGLSVKRDGAPVGSAAWGTATPIDGGEHTVEASAPGKKPFTAKVSIAKEADKQVVRVAALEDAAAPIVERSPGTGAATTVDAGAAASGMPPLRLAGLVVGGAGVVGLGLSAFFGLRASSLNDESKDLGCRADNRCPADALAKRDDAVDASTLATIALIGGGVLAATGATLFVIGGRSGSSEQTRVTATPVVGWGTAGVVLGGSL